MGYFKEISMEVLNIAKGRQEDDFGTFLKYIQSIINERYQYNISESEIKNIVEG
jgi:hypothetical protein